MTNSNMEKFMLSSRPPSARAKIEDPNAPEATFTGTGQLVSGGRKLSQSGRVSINPPMVRAHTCPLCSGTMQKAYVLIPPTGTSSYRSHWRAYVKHLIQP